MSIIFKLLSNDLIVAKGAQVRGIINELPIVATASSGDADNTLLRGILSVQDCEELNNIGLDSITCNSL